MNTLCYWLLFPTLVSFLFFVSKHCQASGITIKRYPKRKEFSAINQFAPFSSVPYPNFSHVLCGLKCQHRSDCNAYIFDEDTEECTIGKFDYGYDASPFEPELQVISTEEQVILTKHFTNLELQNLDINDFYVVHMSGFMPFEKPCNDKLFCPEVRR